MHPQYKRHFSVSFLRHYRAIALKLHHLSYEVVNKKLVFDYAVQLFTIPQLAAILVQEHSASKILFESLAEYV